MKGITIVVLIVAAIVMVFFVMPAFAPTVTAESILRNGKIATGDALP